MGVRVEHCLLAVSFGRGGGRKRAEKRLREFFMVMCRRGEVGGEEREKAKKKSNQLSFFSSTTRRHFDLKIAGIEGSRSGPRVRVISKRKDETDFARDAVRVVSQCPREHKSLRVRPPESKEKNINKSTHVDRVGVDHALVVVFQRRRRRDNRRHVDGRLDCLAVLQGRRRGRRRRRRSGGGVILDIVGTGDVRC